MKAKIPKNTDINTRWAMKNFTDWLSDYNLRNPESVCPEEVILPSCPAETLNKWFQPPNKATGTAQYNNCTINMYSVPPNNMYSMIPSCFPPMVPPLVPVDYNVHSTYLPNYSSEQCDEKNYDC